ncbi:MAG: hypothetical protein AAGJ95_16660 [Cyanobacteria bacterium J06554_11]
MAFCLEETFVALASLQLDLQVGFYSSFLTVEPTVQTASYAEFQLNSLRLAIFVPSADNKAEFGNRQASNSSSAMSLCLEVSDLEGAIAHLIAIGHPPPGDIMQASHGKEIYAYDPDGNRLILHQSLSRSTA